MPYLHIWSMLLSGQVPHRINSSQLFWNRLFQKKKPSRVCACVCVGAGRGGEEGGLGRTLFWKIPWNCFGFFCTSWKFQVKQNSTPGNLVKLCMFHSFEIFRPKTKTSANLAWIFLDFPWCSTLLLINSWKFCMLFLEYPWKFYILNNLPPCLDFFRIVKSQRPCASSNTVL